MSDISTTSRKDMPNDHFAVPSKRALPLYDKGKLSKKHIKLAWDMVDRTKDLSSEEKEEARKKILEAAKKVGIDTSDWEKAVTDDIIVAPVEILDSAAAEGESKPLRVRLRATRANVVNDNNRLYPDPVLDSAMERFKERIQTGRAVGENPHPRALKGVNGKPVFDTNATKSVWKHLDVFKDSDGWWNTDVELIPTAIGKDIEANIRAGVPVGDSMRAIGRWVTRNVNGRNVEVATHLDIYAFDCVMNEATAGSQLVSVLDSSSDAFLDAQAVSDILNADPPMEEGETLDNQQTEETPKYAVLGVGESITDSIKFTDKPVDPSSGEELTPQDPDNDGDVDFYTNSKGDVFMADKSLHHETHAHHYLRQLQPDTDGDGYRLAHQWMKDHQQKPATDSLKGDEQMPSIEELLQSDAFKNAVAQAAQEIAKPALDAVQAQEHEKARQNAKNEARSHVQSRLDEMKGKLSESSIKSIMDSIGDRAESKEQADALLDGAIDLMSKMGAQSALNDIGFSANANQNTATRVEVTNEPKPWQATVDSIVNAMDDYGRELGHEPDMALRKVNKPIVDRIVKKFEKDNGYQQMTDSAAFLDSVNFDNITDAISITTGQLLNQPTILEAVIVQAFQDVESSQFMMIETFEGSEWRIPVETYTSAATVNAGNELLDIIVPEGQGIPEANTNLNWLSYSPLWRRNAFSMTEDALRNLLTGPAKYPAVARAIYHLGYEKRRKLDLAAYQEMIIASDEYNPKVVSSETAASGNLNAVSDGTNVTYSYQLQAASGLTFPVVRPRQKVEITSANGQTTTVTANPFNVTVGGTALVRGYLNADGSIGSFNGQTATYAVDWENGIVYFTSGSGVSTTALPTVSYSASTNYDTWDAKQPTSGNLSTLAPAEFYNGLIQQVTKTTNLMASAPRFKRPNTAIMSLNTSNYVENAAMFYEWQSPNGSEFTPVTDNNFGKRSGVNFNRINAPWVAGDGRILLTQKGSTRYGIQTPYEMQGPFPKYDSNGDVIDAKVWYGRENSVLATPQVTDVNGKIINPVSRTIRILNAGS